MLRREDDHVLRRALDFDIEGQRKKGSLERSWKEQVVVAVSSPHQSPICGV